MGGAGRALNPDLLRGGRAELSAVPEVRPPFSRRAPHAHCRSLPEALVDLVSGVVRLCPAVCDPSHFAVLLGAYGASLSVLGEDGRAGTGGVTGRGCPPSDLTCH